MLHLSNHYSMAEWLFQKANLILSFSKINSFHNIHDPGFVRPGPCLPLRLHLVPLVPWLMMLQWQWLLLKSTQHPPPLLTSVSTVPSAELFFSVCPHDSLPDTLGFISRVTSSPTSPLAILYTVDHLSPLLLSVSSPRLFPFWCLLLFAIILLICPPHWHVILHEGRDSSILLATTLPHHLHCSKLFLLPKCLFAT